MTIENTISIGWEIKLSTPDVTTVWFVDRHNKKPTLKDWEKINESIDKFLYHSELIMKALFQPVSVVARETTDYGMAGDIRFSYEQVKYLWNQYESFEDDRDIRVVSGVINWNAILEYTKLLHDSVNMTEIRFFDIPYDVVNRIIYEDQYRSK